MTFRKSKRQRAVITLTDDDNGGFKANVVYEPSIFKRSTQSPAVNAAVRLSVIIEKTKGEIGQPFETARP